MAECQICREPLGFFDGFSNERGRYCTKCHLRASKEDALKQQMARQAEAFESDSRKTSVQLDIQQILVTTETHPDIAIRRRLGIVSAEVAFGMNAFKDLFASVRNIVGGRSETVQKTMREARETVLFELKREAHSIGGNVVVGVDLDYTQIGDSSWGMVLLVASGTAVVADENAQDEAR